MPADWQLLYRYKHNLVQKWRVRFIGARFDATQRALISPNGHYRIQLNSENQISVLKS